MKLLWVKDKIIPNSSYPRMLAADNKILFPIGGLSAFESGTGKWLWRADVKPDQLYATKNSIYFSVRIAPGSGPYVGALDLNDGGVRWRGHPIGGVKFIHITFVDDLVYASADGYKLYDAYTGDVLFTGNSSMIKADENGRWFIQPPDPILAELLPSYNGRKFFSYFSSPKSTDVWQYESLLSNEVITDQITWGVTTDGTLEGKHIQSGEIHYSVQFSVEGFTRNDGKYGYIYHIAVDPVDDFVFVWLSSSEQLFAFSFSKQ